MQGLQVRRSERLFPQWLYQLTLDMFALVQYWQPSIGGAERGRLFEHIFHKYCANRGLAVSERPGSRTVRHERSASGFNHESDGVLAQADSTIHVELKHLTSPLGKNDLLIFNGKGMDFLLGGSASFQCLPLYRLLVSGEVLSLEARRFALQWGIAVIEPDRLPLLTLHQLAGCEVPQLDVEAHDLRDEVWDEVPHLMTSLQQRIHRFSSLLERSEQMLNDHRIDRAINALQRVAGDAYWTALDLLEPRWLEQCFDALCIELRLDSTHNASEPTTGERGREPRARRTSIGVRPTTVRMTPRATLPLTSADL